MIISRKTMLVVLCIYFIPLMAFFAYLNNANAKSTALNLLEESRNTSDPILISIPKLNLIKPVKLGIYDFKQNTWEITSQYAYFASLSAKPNKQSGNTIIYAHNTNSLFGKVSLLGNNDKVYLRTKNGKIFVYSYEKRKDVKPSDVSIFTPSNKPYLTLLTCTGRNNSLRRLLYFKLVKVV